MFYSDDVHTGFHELEIAFLLAEFHAPKFHLEIPFPMCVLLALFVPRFTRVFPPVSIHFQGSLPPRSVQPSLHLCQPGPRPDQPRAPSPAVTPQPEPVRYSLLKVSAPKQQEGGFWGRTPSGLSSKPSEPNPILGGERNHPVAGLFLSQQLF